MSDFAFLSTPTRELPWHKRAALSPRGWGLWLLLMTLLAALLGALIWLAHEHGQQRAQRALARDATDAAIELGRALSHNAQILQGLHLSQADPASWALHARPLLQSHREWLQLDWLDSRLRPVASETSPWHARLDPPGRSLAAEAQAACVTAERLNGPAYAPSLFMPQHDGGAGHEVMPLCVPVDRGYVVAAYSLSAMLAHMVDTAHTRRHQVSLAEPDGTRLAVAGVVRHGSRAISFQRVLDLPGATLVLRMDSRRPAASLLSSEMTALLAGLALALLAVLTLLAYDHARRQRAESALAEALAVRKAMEDSLMVGLRARDQQGRIVYVNPAFCEMVDCDESELLGTGIPAPYWPPELAAGYAQHQIQWLSGLWRKTEEGQQAIYQRKDGTRFPVLVFDAPLVTHDGRHIGWMSVVMDVSEQRRIEQMTRDSQERLQATARLAAAGEMASHLSHELNQPLAAISSYATGSLNLLEQLHGGQDAAVVADLRTALTRIAGQANRAGQVIHSVHLAVRRGSDQRVNITPQALVQAILPLVHLHADRQNVTVEVDVPHDLPPVWCAQVMVEQVLLNLARNAIQAMSDTPPPLRSLRFSARLALSCDKVIFSVADHGCGIAPGVAPRLYTPFFTTKSEGMGLGLPLCRTVVEQHGGTLTHEANEPQGTVFSFTLPVAVAGQAEPFEDGAIQKMADFH